MKQQDYIPTRGVLDGFDFDAHYTVRGVRGVAWRILGWAVDRYDDDGEPESERVHLVGVMVGDDRHERIEPSELTLLPEDGFCRECGQLGCKHAVWS